MDTTRFTDLLNAATLGLKDDPELRCAVKSELSDHLEESVRQLAAEGHSELESRELAINAFGSPLEVSGKLLAVNKRRMKLRALVRLTLRALLVPAALLSALYLAWAMLSQTQQELSVMKGCDFEYATTAKNSGAQIAEALEWVPGLPALPLQSAQPAWDRQFTDANIQALWQKDPANKVYFAHYASYASGNRFNHFDNKLNPQQPIEAYFNLMRDGERIDPGNALYNYLSCEALLSAAVMEKNDNTQPYGYHIELADRELSNVPCGNTALDCASPVAPRITWSCCVSGCTSSPLLIGFRINCSAWAPWIRFYCRNLPACAASPAWCPFIAGCCGKKDARRRLTR